MKSAIRNRMRPIHPGEVLKEEFLVPLDMSATQLALHLHVPANRITMIVNKERAVTAETALRLSRFFETTADFWMNLQKTYELRLAEEESGAAIAREVQPKRKSA
jgi:addiction module HigA family antidote